MAGFLDIKQGGRIRYNAVAALGQTWSRGQVLVINSAEQLELLNSNNINLSTSGLANGQVAGLAMETCVAASTGNVVQNTLVVLAGNTGSVLLGEAVVVTDNLSGTGGWIAGASRVYAQAGGNVSYNAASGLQVGVALSNPVSNGRLKFLFTPPTGV